MPSSRGRHRQPSFHDRLCRLLEDETGMSTAEYAIGTIAAAAFAAVLYTIVTGDSVVTALTGLVEQALSVKL
jgi:Flp pilus assembly pilin Flp